MSKTILCIYDGKNKATHEVCIEPNDNKWVSACKSCAKDSANGGYATRAIQKSIKQKKLSAAQLKKMIEEINIKINEKTVAVLEKRLATIESDVNRMMDRHLNDILMSSLGFSTSFGRLEVDHCNGRKTAIANQVGDMAMTILRNTDYQKWFESVQVDKNQLLAMKEAVNKEFKNSVHEELRRNMYEKVKARAKTEVDQLLDVLGQEDINKIIEDAFNPNKGRHNG